MEIESRWSQILIGNRHNANIDPHTRMTSVTVVLQTALSVIFTREGEVKECDFLA